MRRILLSLTAIAIPAAAIAEPFTFVALGDAPYGKPEEVFGPFATLIETINARSPSLVIHVGDTKSGSTPCDDKMLTDQLNFMGQFTAPVLYTPGDNEWTDCHRESAGSFDPLDRLAFIRTNYFDTPDMSLGADPVAVESQAAAGFPENQRMTHASGVMFVTAHVVGSNNNFEVRDPAAVTEFFARDTGSTNWLKESFAAATAANAPAIVVAIHANMFEFDWNEFDDGTFLRHSGFLNFGNALRDGAAAFGKPVLLVYGDSHTFRQSRPWPEAAPDLMALEVPGDKLMHAVEITVDPASSGVFSVDLVLNPDVPLTE